MPQAGETHRSSDYLIDLEVIPRETAPALIAATEASRCSPSAEEVAMQPDEPSQEEGGGSDCRSGASPTAADRDAHVSVGAGVRTQVIVARVRHRG